MNITRLQDRIDRGLGTAARHIGAQADAYRPNGPANPLAPEPTVTSASTAAFNDENLTFRRPITYGRATWSGIFDRAYTRPGDYLAGPDQGTFFIAAQQSLLPALCILTNRTLTVTRPAAPATAGVNAYGGLLATLPPPRPHRLARQHPVRRRRLPRRAARGRQHPHLDHPPPHHARPPSSPPTSSPTT